MLLPHWAEADSAVTHSHANRLAKEKSSYLLQHAHTLNVNIVSSAGQTVFKKKQQVNMPSGISPLFNEALDTRSLKGTYAIKVQVVADTGLLITENKYSFDVFTADQLTVPKKHIAVLDPGNALKPFLKKSGIVFERFSAGTDHSVPVFVPVTQAKTKAERTRFGELSHFINAGGKAVYLQAGGTYVKWGTPDKASSLLPVTLRLKRGLGHWMGHPRFGER